MARQVFLDLNKHIIARRKLIRFLGSNRVLSNRVHRLILRNELRNLSLLELKKLEKEVRIEINKHNKRSPPIRRRGRVILK